MATSYRRFLACGLGVPAWCWCAAGDTTAHEPPSTSQPSSLDSARHPYGKEEAGRRDAFGNLLSALLLLVSLTGCGAMNIASCKGDERFVVQEWMYFGTEMPSGHVMPEAWRQFLSEVVTPRFPDGFSAWQASGQWRSASGEVIREPAYVVSLVHPDDAALSKAVREIIASYKTRFQQESVLRVKAHTCLSR